MKNNFYNMGMGKKILRLGATAIIAHEGANLTLDSLNKQDNNLDNLKKVEKTAQIEEGSNSILSKVGVEIKDGVVTVLSNVANSGELKADNLNSVGLKSADYSEFLKTDVFSNVSERFGFSESDILYGFKEFGGEHSFVLNDGTIVVMLTGESLPKNITFKIDMVDALLMSHFAEYYGNNPGKPEVGSVDALDGGAYFAKKCKYKDSGRKANVTINNNTSSRKPNVTINNNTSSSLNKNSYKEDSSESVNNNDDFSEISKNNYNTYKEASNYNYNKYMSTIQANIDKYGVSDVENKRNFNVRLGSIKFSENAENYLITSLNNGQSIEDIYNHEYDNIVGLLSKEDLGNKLYSDSVDLLNKNIDRYKESSNSFKENYLKKIISIRIYLESILD